MLGPYELRGELGRGAMAVVWRGWDSSLDREVAIKEPLIPTGMDADAAAEFTERFVREGKAAAGLNHPGIITIHAAGVYDSRPAIVMELIEGETLSTVLDRGPLSPAATIAILDQLLDAVAYAHERGVVHRDIKPDNVFVTHDGRVKLADFGIAHVGSSATLTQAGTVMGTPGYMAPEQVTGQPIDARADIFAIGSIAYEMLAGHNPFGATEGVAPTTVMYRIVHEQPPSLPEGALAGLPVALVPVIGTALAKDPADRFSDAGAFRAALAGAPIVTGRQAGVSGAPAASSPGWGSQAAAASVVGQPGGNPTWMPYAIVGGIAVVLLVGMLFFSGGVPGGEGTSGAVAQNATAKVAVTSPSAGSSALAGSDMILSAEVVGASGEVTFLVNGASVGSARFAPYSATYTPPSAGTINVSAKVRLANNTEVSSVPIAVTVTAPSDPAVPAVEGVNTPEMAKAAVMEWRARWEARDFEGYMDFYAPSFYSKYKKMNRSKWRAYKRGLFSRYAYQKVGISNLKIAVSGDRATVTFTQRFESDSYRDKGKKTLRMQVLDGSWKITGEEFK